MLVITDAELVGLEPKGMVQLEPMVTSPEPVLLIVTEEKVTVPQVKVESSALLVPSKVTARLLGSRLPELLRFPSRLRVVKEAAVKVPPLKVRVPPSVPTFISQVVVLVMVKLEPLFWV